MKVTTLDVWKNAFSSLAIQVKCHNAAFRSIVYEDISEISDHQTAESSFVPRREPVGRGGCIRRIIPRADGRGPS
jgi:hypothetical protein